jgi:hypothetical protein
MSGPIYYPEIIVAAIDISGMKNLMKKNDNLNSATKIIGQFCGNIDNNSHLQIHWKQFGDLAYLIGNPNDPIDTQVSKIAFSVANLIAFGLLANEMKICDNFLLRSGISKGDLKAAQWNSLNAKGNYFIGNSMVKAYKLEESQDWFGACIDFDIDCSNINNKIITKYNMIPLKRKWINKKKIGYAINWLPVFRQIINQYNINIEFEENALKRHIESITEEIGYSKAGEKKIMRKVKNTGKFVQYCL